MSEQRFRQNVCQAVHQLWLRGLIAGEGGAVTAELHRRRYLTTPAGARRADLRPEDLICVDLGGLDIAGGPGVPEAAWLPHRTAYRIAADPATDAVHRPRATVLAEPPMLLALARRANGDSSLTLGDARLPVCDATDEGALAAALREGGEAILPGVGLLVAGPSLAAALCRVERLDHWARIELAAPPAAADYEQEKHPPTLA